MRPTRTATPPIPPIPHPTPHPPFPLSPNLPHLPTRLSRHSLLPLLTLDPRPRLAPRPRHRALGLLRLLLALARALLLLPLLDGRLPRRLPRFGALRAPLLDYLEGGADDAALGLYGAAGAFFGDFLGRGDSTSVRVLGGRRRGGRWLWERRRGWGGGEVVLGWIGGLGDWEGRGEGEMYLRDTLLVLASVERRPGDTARVLALEEEGFGLAVLEAEDLAVAADVEFALQLRMLC